VLVELPYRFPFGPAALVAGTVASARISPAAYGADAKAHEDFAACDVCPRVVASSCAKWLRQDHDS